MTTLQKQWDNGDIVTIAYNGDGNGSVPVGSVVNEGIDRSMTIVASTIKGSPVIQQSIVVNQLGKREVFMASNDGLILADGGTFNVLKNELQ